MLSLPRWADSDRFDIDARFNGAENTEDEAKVMRMVQALLADRFELKVPREMRQLPIYELVAAKGGTKMAVSAQNAEPRERGGRGLYQVTHGSMPQLASHLSLVLGRKVEDKTGASSLFDYTLRRTPDEYQRNVLPGRPDAGVPDFNSSSLFTALQEQLGLQLESSRGPVEVFVVDSARKPSPN